MHRNHYTEARGAEAKLLAYFYRDLGPSAEPTPADCAAIRESALQALTEACHWTQDRRIVFSGPLAIDPEAGPYQEQRRRQAARNAAIAALKQEGRNTRQIAEALDIHKTTVRRLIKKIAPHRSRCRPVSRRRRDTQ